MAKDFYATLGVNKGRERKEIRSACRRLARKLHPDVNPNDKRVRSQFKEINAAYDVLSDADKRKEVRQARRELGARGRDRAHAALAARAAVSLAAAVAAGPACSSRATSTSRTCSAASSVAARDVAAGRRRGKPPDTEQPIEITLDEALTGTTRILITEGERGEIAASEVKVPPGVDTGSRVRMAGEGRPGFDGRRSDLYLVITVRPHARYDRKGDDLYTDVEVPLTTPVLGGEVEVQALDKKVALRLPAGTQNGQTFRLTGLGMPKLSQPDKRGDLFARVKVRLPQSAGDRERELFEELKNLGY